MDAQDIIEVLNKLIVACKDGELGCRRGARHARTLALRAFLAARADDWARAAEELQRMCLQCGGEPHEIAVDGSASGTLRRRWTALKRVLAGPDDLAALEQCARGEDSALEHYREALDVSLPAPLHVRVERQYLDVLRNQALAGAWRVRERAVRA